MQEIQFLEFMVGSNLPQAYPDYLIYLHSSGNRTPGSRFYSDLLDTSVCIHQLVLKRLSKR